MPTRVAAQIRDGPSWKFESTTAFDLKRNAASTLPSNMPKRTFQNSSPTSGRSGKPTKTTVGSATPAETRHPFLLCCTRKVRFQRLKGPRPRMLPGKSGSSSDSGVQGFRREGLLDENVQGRRRGNHLHGHGVALEAPEPEAQRARFYLPPEPYVWTTASKQRQSRGRTTVIPAPDHVLQFAGLRGSATRRHKSTMNRQLLAIFLTMHTVDSCGMCLCWTMECPGRRFT
ncbi:hypothetical protein MTO96_010871 [Rhipicephalus appendiculatus]